MSESRRGRFTAVATVGVLVLLSAAAGAWSTATSPSRGLGPSLPQGWKTVSYRGIEIYVPRPWAVVPWRANCGPNTPTVYVGPQERSVLFCPDYTSGAAVVVLGSLALPGFDATHSQTLNGLQAFVVRATDPHARCGHHRATLTNIWTRLPHDVRIYVSAGESPVCPGGASGRAEEIIDTVHSLRSHRPATSGPGK